MVGWRLEMEKHKECDVRLVRAKRTSKTHIKYGANGYDLL